tara:strand:- start:586 stop:777 length:192 start_codon:yes stop_codon:yes gene_type:complete
MNENDVQKLVNLRALMIECYNRLDGLQSGGANVAVVKQTQVGHDYEEMISQIDSILRPHVKFQ